MQDLRYINQGLIRSKNSILTRITIFKFEYSQLDHVKIEKTFSVGVFHKLHRQEEVGR